jgi:trimeric autotransporter adhesin
VNFNRGVGSSTRQTVLLTFFGAMFCLTSFLTAGAQTYTPNDIYTIAGGGAVPTSPLLADIPGPTAAIKDSKGNIYIAAQDAAYVYELSTSGSLSVFAGLGYSGYSNDGKQANTALIGGVDAMAIDGKGNIYLADAVGSRIRKVAPSGIISTVAGNGTKCDKAGVCGDGGKASSANLNLPGGVAIGANGVLYIADTTDNRIRAVNLTTAAVTVATIVIQPGNIATVAGSPTGAICNNPQGACGDGQVAATAGLLTLPSGIAVDGAGNMYIADTRDQKARYVINATGIIRTLAGNGIPCQNPVSGCGDGLSPLSARLTLPKAVFRDNTGNYYIADTGDSRIRFIPKGAGALISTVVNDAGTEGFSGDGGTALAAQLNLPGGVFVDTTGNILISDSGNQRLREVSAGNISSIAGGGMGGDGGLPTNATLAVPWGVAKDSSGNLYVVDQGNNRIRKITNPGQSSAVISTYAGNGNAGYSGDGGLATGATLNGPSSIAFDTLGNLYIADSNNLVIREVNPGTGIITTVFGNGAACVPLTAACGDGGPPLGASFAFPLTVTLDSANNVYVSDYQGYKVREWNTTSNVVSTVAGNGFQGFKGNGGPATAARINHPAGLVVDTLGTIIISDQWNDVVRCVSAAAPCGAPPVTGNIYNFALNNIAKFSGDGGPALSASMFNPLALAINPSNDLFISGGNDDVVQRVSRATGIFSNVAGYPLNPATGGFAGDGGLATLARLQNLGAFVDASENLYIADGGNNRVRYVPLAPSVSFSPTSMSLGQWPIGVAGNAVPLTLTGGGGADLNITNIKVTGTNAADFSPTLNCQGTPLSPQQTCGMTVTMTPSTFGPETGVLTFTDNAAGSPTQTVALNGFGPDFAISDSPASLTVTRGGTSPASTVSLTPQAKFAELVNLTCSGLPTGASCLFNPSAVQLFGGSVQTSSLTISAASTTAVGVYTVTVTGTFSSLAHTTTITLTVQ